MSKKKNVQEQTGLRSGNHKSFGLASGVLYVWASSAAIIISGDWGGEGGREEGLDLIGFCILAKKI